MRIRETDTSIAAISRDISGNRRAVTLCISDEKKSEGKRTCYKNHNKHDYDDMD